MPWVDIAEAAFTLGVSERTIRNWLKSGKLEARTTNGRREVHIPEAEAGGRGQAFVDDMEEEEGGNGLGVQKRLEVALIECGRVKGTLASQERMMETLSSNIAELNAKLQRNERVIARRTIWCVVAVFIGILGWVVTKSLGDATVADHDKTYREEKITLIQDHQTNIDKRQKEFKDEMSDAKKEHEQKIDLLKAQHAKEKEAALTKLKAELENRHAKEAAKLNAQLDKLSTERDKLNTEKITAEARLTAKTSELALSETRLAEAETRIAELEKTRQELESEVVKLKGN